MNIHKPGSKIHLGPNKDIEGRINQVIIRPDLNIIYKCSWWNNGARLEEFLYADEFSVDKPNKLTIGFK